MEDQVRDIARKVYIASDIIKMSLSKNVQLDPWTMLSRTELVVLPMVAACVVVVYAGFFRPANMWYYSI